MAGSQLQETSHPEHGWLARPTLPADPPITFVVDGVEETFRPATSWLLDAWSRADWATIATRAAPHILNRLTDPDDPFDLADAAELAVGISETLAGRPWPALCRLSAQLVADWPLIEAWALHHTPGVDLLTSPPRRVLAAVYAFVMAGCEKESEATRLESRLNSPTGIPGLLTRTADGGRRAPWSEDREASDFMAAAAAFGTPLTPKAGAD